MGTNELNELRRERDALHKIACALMTDKDDLHRRVRVLDGFLADHSQRLTILDRTRAEWSVMLKNTIQEELNRHGRIERNLLQALTDMQERDAASLILPKVAVPPPPPTPPPEVEVPHYIRQEEAALQVNALLAAMVGTGNKNGNREAHPRRQESSIEAAGRRKLQERKLQMMRGAK